jgi:hypothetical protein
MKSGTNIALLEATPLSYGETKKICGGKDTERQLIHNSDKMYGNGYGKEKCASYGTFLHSGSANIFFTLGSVSDN